MVRHIVLWSGISVIPHSRQVCWFSLMYISASRYVRPYRSFTSRAMILLVGSNGGLPVRLLCHVGGAFPRICLTVERNSRRVIPSMGNGPSQPFRTKHLIWFRDRAPSIAFLATGRLRNSLPDMESCACLIPRFLVCRRIPWKRRDSLAFAGFVMLVSGISRSVDADITRCEGHPVGPFHWLPLIAEVQQTIENVVDKEGYESRS